MAQMDRGRIAVALILILLGVWFLAVQLVPGLQLFALSGTNWPLAIVALGALLALVGLVTWVPGLMVPAAIFAGMGLLMYWQNATNRWESWAYAWTLIPGFVGVGLFVGALMRGRLGEAFTAGGWLVLISAVLFLIFGSMFGVVAPLGAYWPLLLVLLGVLLLAQSLLRGRKVV